MQKVNVSIILACYNEGPSLSKSVSSIVTILKSLKKKWEIIFVEDRSTDETKKTVEELVRKIPNSRAIYHARNLGRGKSVSDGIISAKGDICGYLDVDLEISANFIPLFVKEIEIGSDLATGKRFYEGHIKSVVRFMASKAYATVVKSLLNIPIEDTEAGYKFFRRKKILPILAKVRDKEWFWDTEICARSYWSGLKISQIPVLFIKRPDKKSTVKLIPDTLKYLIKILKFRGQVPKKFRQT